MEMRKYGQDSSLSYCNLDIQEESRALSGEVRDAEGDGGQAALAGVGRVGEEWRVIGRQWIEVGGAKGRYEGGGMKERWEMEEIGGEGGGSGGWEWRRRGGK
jgi:hypothetical protein